MNNKPISHYDFVILDCSHIKQISNANSSVSVYSSNEWSALFLIANSKLICHTYILYMCVLHGCEVTLNISIKHISEKPWSFLYTIKQTQKRQ